MAPLDTVHPEHTGSLPSMAPLDTVHPEHKTVVYTHGFMYSRQAWVIYADVSTAGAALETITIAGRTKRPFNS